MALWGDLSDGDSRVRASANFHWLELASAVAGFKVGFRVRGSS